jgi:hypothetical protein
LKQKYGIIHHNTSLLYMDIIINSKVGDYIIVNNITYLILQSSVNSQSWGQIIDPYKRLYILELFNEDNNSKTSLMFYDKNINTLDVKSSYNSEYILK